ncbi:MAG: hypothetical protein ABFD92_04000 [Planctomycetaceae bacterium]|nr:hypothetical protein [Planctomycetaceae bacterium]
MKRVMAIALAATVLIVIQTAWTQQKAEERLAAARERLQVRSLRSAVQSFYRSLDNDDTEAATGQVAKVKKLWDALDADLQGKIDKSRPGTGQRVADLESECSMTAAPATSQPASEPAPAAASADVKTLPTSRPAPKGDDNVAPPSTELVRMGETAPVGKLAARSPVVKEVAAAEPHPGGPWRPKYANDYDIFGDHPKGRCEQYKGGAQESAAPLPVAAPAPAGTPRPKTAQPGKEGGSIDQIIKTAPVQKTPRKKK